MAKKMDEDSGNTTKDDANNNDDFVVRQPSVTRLAFTNDSLVFKKIEVFLEAPDELVDVAHGAGDNDQIPEIL